MYYSNFTVFLFASGQSVDSPSNGKAPVPWSIPIVPAKVFQTEVQELEVPHTATVLVSFN